MDACATGYQYAAISDTDAVCLCGNNVSGIRNVSDEHCSQYCTMLSDDDVCDYYDVYWREQGVVGLLLHTNDRVNLFTKSWYNASVLNQGEVEFR